MYRPELKVDNKPLMDLPKQYIWVEGTNSNLGGQSFGYYLHGTFMQASKRKRLWESATKISELIKLTQE